MQFSLSFALELKFDYIPAEYESGHLFQHERMELSDSNLELSDAQIALFEAQALKAFKAEQTEAAAVRAYELSLENGKSALDSEKNPWFFAEQLTDSEQAAAEIFAEQSNLYYYTL